VADLLSPELGFAAPILVVVASARCNDGCSLFSGDVFRQDDESKVQLLFVIWRCINEDDASSAAIMVQKLGARFLSSPATWLLAHRLLW